MQSSPSEPLQFDPTAALEPIMEALVGAFRGGGKLLVCGNGGSAADSEHVVGELMKRFMLPRPIGAELVEALTQIAGAEGASLAESLERALPAISLNSQTSLLTAIGNDRGFENVFAQQVLGYGQPGDVLLAFSTSGDSQNVVRALITARAIGVITVAFTGEGGGRAAQFADYLLAVPATTTATVQELHMKAYHSLCATLERIFFLPQEARD